MRAIDLLRALANLTPGDLEKDVLIQTPDDDDDTELVTVNLYPHSRSGNLLIATIVSKGGKNV